jgi:hypothetical protein
VDINRTLLREIEPFLFKYDCELREVERILSPSGSYEYSLSPRLLSERRIKVLNSISAVLEPHGKRHLFEHVSQLNRVENGVRTLVPRHRDHVIHALLCFLLGIYINEKYISARQANTVNSFQWEIAALFHDIGYPIEIAFKAIINPYFQDLGFNIQSILDEFCELSKGQNSLTLIQEQVDKWSLSINVKSEYSNMLHLRKINHGIVSAITILKRVNTLYEKHNPNGDYNRTLSEDGVDWNQRYFLEDIVPACAAIFVHGLGKQCFQKRKLVLSKAPLAYLLKLSDSLQEWDRPSFRAKYYPSSLFDIEVVDDRLIFTTNIPNDVKEKILTEITDCLKDPKVELR